MYQGPKTFRDVITILEFADQNPDLTPKEVAVRVPEILQLRGSEVREFKGHDFCAKCDQRISLDYCTECYQTPRQAEICLACSCDLKLKALKAVVTK